MVFGILKLTKHLIMYFMNNLRPFLTCLTIVTLSLLRVNTSFSQIETTTYQGETYFVYPLQKEVRSMQDLYYQFVDKKEVIQRDDRNEKIVSITDTALTAQEKKQGINYKGKYKKYAKQMTEILEKYPYFMVSSDNSLAYDPTPALSKIPDGKYLIYYRDIPYVANRVMRYRNDIVAGIFEIKNNVLHGASTWFHPNGQIARTGNYELGEKTGNWFQFTYEESQNQEDFNETMSLEDRLKILKYDTLAIEASFKNGLKDGPFLIRENDRIYTKGNYTKDKESGAWEIYNFKQKVIQENKQEFLVQTDSLILTHKYTLRSDSVRGKSIIIRHNAVHNEFLYERSDTLKLENVFPEGANQYENNYRYRNSNSLNFDQFYTIQKALPQLEMPEETFSSYEGEIYYDGEEEMYYPEMELQESYEEYYEYVNNKRYTLNDLIDSMGYLLKYDGVYEKYYTNGQLQFKCFIQNGTLIEQSDVYWDNGTIANEILFLKDSNQYVQNFYDYNGKKYKSIQYNHRGNVIDKEEFSEAMYEFEGLKYGINAYRPTYTYENYDSLAKGVDHPVIYSKDLFKINNQLASEAIFDPSSKTIHFIGLNLLGDTIEKTETVFSENYSSVQSSTILRVGALQLNRIQNGGLSEYYKQNKLDSISEQVHAFYWSNKYKLDSDEELLVDGQPFTGKFQLKRESNGFKVNATSKSINILLPSVKADKKLYLKQINAFKKSGKAGNLLPFYCTNYLGSNYLSFAVTNLFPNIANTFIDMFGVPDYSENSQKETTELYDEIYGSQLFQEMKIISIEGRYLNGRPEGLWTYKDKKGAVLFTLNYKNGELHGETLQYAVAYPEKKTMENLTEFDYDPTVFYKTHPKKKTRYVSSKSTYKNGMRSGSDVQFDWNGDTLSYTNYVEGRKEGRSFERNIFFYSVANYQYDALDGIVRTYITRKNRDSVLLYDLNFKGGLLQGESKAYHTNGKIAKKGFFLTGQPIDDYEAYDTLGYRFQYVKFQYGQPIEEKIWEENELSVRYEFDWRDSIPFDFSDITTATSVEALLYEIGFESEEMYQPYLGRPSLTEKTGIDYTVTKYYPNDTIARTGIISKGKKSGCWHYYNYKGRKLYEVDYFDTVLVMNDSIQFKAKGILSYVDKNNQIISKNWIIEKIEKYDCAHTDHTEERMLYCFWQADSSQNRINGYVKNYYDNGSLQNEGWVKNGLPTGIWKMYDVNGNLSRVGEYVQGKRNGRWLEGDLGTVKNMSEICLNPNLENLEEILSYQEKLIDISVVLYDMGIVLKRKYYGINMNSGDAPSGYQGMEYGEY